VLILMLPRHRWSLPLIGEKEYDGCGGGALGAPLSLGCCALDVEQEWISEEWNDLFWIVLPLLGSNLSLIYQDRLGTWWFGG
jgi:hypothetical protein